MKLVKSSVELIKQKPGVQGILENVEIGARNCYKSESFIKYDDLGNSITAPGFVDKIVNVYKHKSVAEHGAVYLRIPNDDWNACQVRSVNCWTRDFYLNPYTHINSDGNYYYITTNYRVILENPTLQEPYEKYLVQEPLELHERRITTRWICDRACLAQLTRHRSLSFSVQSQRYVSSCDKKPIIEFNCDDENDIIAAYNQGFSARDISISSSFSEYEIFKILNTNNVNIRNKGSRGNIQLDYFKLIDTPEKAYLLGIIQTDGNILKRQEKKGSFFTITQHEDFSWYIRRMMLEFSDKVGYSKDGNCKAIRIGSNEMVDDLINLGIVPNKTKNQTKEDIEKLWDSIPEKFLGDFIRGLIDGDGHVNYFIQKRGKNESCNIGFCSVNEHLIDKLVTFFKNKFNYSCNKHFDGSVYRIAITNYKVSIEIGKFLYKNFKYPFGHPKKASTWIKRLKIFPETFEFGDPKFEIIVPPNYENYSPEIKFQFLKSMDTAEQSYIDLRILGLKPEDARGVLPNATKTELVVSGFFSDWVKFFNLRCDTHAQADIRNLSLKLLEILNNEMPFLWE